MEIFVFSFCISFQKELKWKLSMKVENPIQSEAGIFWLQRLVCRAESQGSALIRIWEPAFCVLVKLYLTFNSVYSIYLAMESHHKTSSWVLSPGKMMSILQMSADLLNLIKDFLFRATKTSIERKCTQRKMWFQLWSQNRNSKTGLNQYLGKEARLDFENLILNSHDKSVTY